MITFITIIAIIIFVALCLGSVYIVVLFVNSKGFTISPTITSDGKSIKKMAEYIIKHNNENEQKMSLKILDIGSGYGRLLFKMNKLLGNNKNIFIGYEISKFSYKISKFFNKSKNIYLINDDIKNINDTDFDYIISFMLAKQQKSLLDTYKKFPVGTVVLANSNDIPFEKKDGFILTEKIKVHFGWEIFVYKKSE